MARYTHFEVPGSPISPWFDLSINSHYAASDREYIVHNADNTVTHLRGTGLSNEGGSLSGTVESMSRTNSAGTITYETVSGLNVPLARILPLTPTPHFATESIFAGADIFAGWSGADTFPGGPGADAMHGAGGFDWVEYTSAARGVRADLGNRGGNSGDAAGDRFNGIEGVIGSHFGDHLLGDRFYNSLIGGGGNDILAGGASGDRLDGGAGQDWVDFSAAGGAVALDLSTGGGTGGEAAGDLYVGIENVRGSARNDRITGDDGGNVLRGDAGADRLDGGAGQDTADYKGARSAVTVDLQRTAANTGEAKGDSFRAIENIRGTDFNDRLSGDNAGNWLEGGAGADALNGRGGFDLASYYGAAGSVVADLLYPSRNSGAAKGDSFASIEGLVGSRFNDALMGNAADNLLYGGGSEVAPPRGEDGGLDWFDGRGGFDTVSFKLQKGSVYADLTKNSNDAAKKGDVFISVEAVTGSDYDDKILGSGRADVISGEDGNDELVGGGGIDTLRGGKGNDRYNLDHARDTVRELAGEGNDTIVTAALANISLDRYANVENLTYTGARNARLTGEEGANLIEGGAGNDIIDGGRGNDTMRGGKGNDSYYRDFEGDRVVETRGAGADTVYSSLNLFLSDNVENGVLTGRQNLSIYGNALANQLTGNAGNNQFRSGTGADIMTGLGGDDLYFVEARDRVAETAGGGIDIIWTTLSRYALPENVENLSAYYISQPFFGTGNAEANTITGGYGNDVLTGGAGNDTLKGEYGNDTLNGDAGNDVLDGGYGNDTMRGGAGNDSYVVDSAGDVVVEQIAGGTDTVTASISYTLGTYVNNLTLTGQVNGTGNQFANVLTGSEYDNRLSGGAGNDRIVGERGNDTLTGGADTDVFVFRPGFGHDTITDFRVSGAGHDVIQFGDGLFSNAADVFASSANTARGVLISVDGGSSLLIENVTLTQLRAHPEDFQFA